MFLTCFPVCCDRPCGQGLEMVAKGGIEPPTRGLSVLLPNALCVTDRYLPMCGSSDLATVGDAG